MGLGILVSLFLGEIQLRGRGFSFGIGLDIAVVVLPIGLVGARLFYVADHWSFYAVHPVEVFTTSGTSLDGAVVASLIASVIVLRRHRLPLAPPIDTIAVAALLGLVLGSFGSFLAGDASGRAASLGPSVTYPRALQMGSSQAGVYPVELYEAVLYFLAFVFLTNNRSATTRPGEGLGAFLLVVGVDLFGLGFLREQPVDYLDLGQAQFVGAMLAIGGILVLTTGLPAGNRASQLSG